MNQRKVLQLAIFAMLIVGCGQTAPPATAPVARSIVCLSPAGTDLLMQLGLRDRLVGVSAYEANEKLKSALPVVGDYERVDWEKIAELKPGYLVVQGRADRLPPGLQERCDQLGVRLVVLQIDRLVDIDTAMARLREALEMPAELTESIIQKATPAKPAEQVPALIVLNENGKFVAGQDNFLNDLLTRAGGRNVITATGYPTIDQEFLQTLSPRVIFVLMPGASDTSIEQAKANLQLSSSVPAVRDGRVVVIDRADALLPSWTNVVTLSGEFLAGLRGNK
jgi:iron complex transport system substrate-binding protein